MTLYYEKIRSSKRLLAWVEDRIPLLSFTAAHTADHYAPKNFKVWCGGVYTAFGIERTKPVPRRVTAST